MRNIFFILAILFSVTSFGQIKGNLQTYVGGQGQLTINKNGGRWTSSVTANATIGSATGVVTGVHQGFTKIKYGSNDSVMLYVSSIDSSGYYFVAKSFQDITGTYSFYVPQMQERNYNGSSILNIWCSSVTAAYNGDGAYGSLSTQRSYRIVYNSGTGLYTIIFLALQNGSLGNQTLQIPPLKIKYFDGAKPYSTPDSVVSQIIQYGF